MIYIFRKLKFIPPLLVPLLSLPFWIKGFTEAGPVPLKHSMPLFELLNYLLGFSFVVKAIAAWVLMLVNAYYLNYLLDHFNLLLKKSFIPALMYCLLMSLYPGFTGLHPLLPATTCMLFGIHKIMLTYRTGLDIADFFDGAFFFSLAGLFYFPAVWFFPLIWVSLIVIRPFIWREWTGAWTGFLLPFVFCFSYYYVFDDTRRLVNDKIFFPQDFVFVNPMNFPLAMQITAGCMFLFSLLVVVAFLLHSPAKTIFSRNISVIQVWWLLFAVTVYFIAPDNHPVYLSFAAVPLTYYLSHWFLEGKRTWVRELVFWIFLGVLLQNHYPQLMPPGL